MFFFCHAIFFQYNLRKTFLRAFRMGGASQQSAFSTKEFTVLENNIQVQRSKNKGQKY